MNLIADPILTLSNGTRVSLPSLFAAMTCGDVQGFAMLRPHQRPAWHMFLVQLATLALWTAGRDEPPEDDATWASTLRALTPDHTDDAPWRLAVADKTKPAFLQAPTPQGLKWSEVATPDALDMLITARNHDLKQAVARQASMEDWVYALVSLQTCEGYGGRGNNGIARMNGGSSSRSLLGLTPVRGPDVSINPSVWWARDVKRLLAARENGSDGGVGTPGGSALLWLLDWPEGELLDLRHLDPWFIEICRRVRLFEVDGRLAACRATSRSPRIDAKVHKGNTGDPWTSLHTDDAKSLTLGETGEFDYSRLCELLFSGNWSKPLLARPDDGETGDMLLVAEAFARGNSKTGGFKSRVVPVPGKVVPLFATGIVGTLAEAQMQEIKIFDLALRNALALIASGGSRESVDKKHYGYASPARKRFDRTVDRLFFPSLWHRANVATGSGNQVHQAKLTFLRDLMNAAETEFKLALPAMPCPAILRPRAEARARRAFRNRIWRSFPEVFDREHTDEAA